NDRGISHCDLANIAARHAAKMDCNADTKRSLGPRPAPIGRKLENRQWPGEADWRLGSLLVSRRPIGKQRVPDIFVDNPSSRLHGIPDVAKPIAYNLREFAFAQFFGHRAETTDVADQNRDRQDGLMPLHTPCSKRCIDVSGGPVAARLMETNFDILD